GSERETEAGRGIGRGAAALAEDILGAREADDVVDGEEIGRVAELTNELELVPDRLFDGRRNAAGVARLSAEARQELQLLLRRTSIAGGLIRILIGQLFEAEAACPRYFLGA